MASTNSFLALSIGLTLIYSSFFGVDGQGNPNVIQAPPGGRLRSPPPPSPPPPSPPTLLPPLLPTVPGVSNVPLPGNSGLQIPIFTGFPTEQAPPGGRLRSPPPPSPPPPSPPTLLPPLLPTVPGISNVPLPGNSGLQIPIFTGIPTVQAPPGGRPRSPPPPSPPTLLPPLLPTVPGISNVPLPGNSGLQIPIFTGIPTVQAPPGGRPRSPPPPSPPPSSPPPPSPPTLLPPLLPTIPGVSNVPLPGNTGLQLPIITGPFQIGQASPPPPSPPPPSPSPPPPSPPPASPPPPTPSPPPPSPPRNPSSSTSPPPTPSPPPPRSPSRSPPPPSSPPAESPHPTRSSPPSPPPPSPSPPPPPPPPFTIPGFPFPAGNPIIIPPLSGPTIPQATQQVLTIDANFPHSGTPTLTFEYTPRAPISERPSNSQAPFQYRRMSRPTKLTSSDRQP